MVAGLAFLSKKSFHTKNLDNQERVWIAEQKQAAEDQKTKELARQIQQEREQEELQKLTGKKKGLDRGIDWMYEGGKALDNDDSQQEALAKDQEDYLLGKEYTGGGNKGADSGPGSKVTVAGDFVQALSSGGPGRSVNAVLESTAAAASEEPVPLAFVDKNEEFRLRHEDPMYMIEQKRLAQSADATKKKALFDRVMGNGMGRPVKKRDHSSDDNDDDDDEEAGRRRDKDRSSRKRERKEERKRDRKSRHHRDRDDRHRRSNSRDRHEDRHSRKRHRHDRKAREYSRSRSRERYDRDDGDRDRHRHASQSRSRSRDREYSRKKRGSSRDDRGRRSRSFSPTNDRGYQERHRHHHHDRDDRKDPPSPQKNSTYRPTGYGLVGGTSSNVKVTTNELGPDRALLAKKRQQEQEAQNARRRKEQRRPMTNQEKAEALRAMQQDATTRESHRVSQITKGKQDKGTDDGNMIGPGEASFLRDISARTHGLHASDMTSMATRVARNRHTNQRTDDSFL
eukprot:scaffold6007_cov47-Attheya_sp.AAC.3